MRKLLRKLAGVVMLVVLLFVVVVVFTGSVMEAINILALSLATIFAIGLVVLVVSFAIYLITS